MHEFDALDVAVKYLIFCCSVVIFNVNFFILIFSLYLGRLRALRDMLESVARAEDIVKVHEARLTEKETTSLSPQEVEEYLQTLKVKQGDYPIPMKISY